MHCMFFLRIIVLLSIQIYFKSRCIYFKCKCKIKSWKKLTTK